MHRIELTLNVDPSVRPDPLFPYIRIRSVDRRRYSTRPLSQDHKSALSGALGDGLRVRWHESLEERKRVAALNALATDVRLRLRSAYEVHTRIIDWNARFSRTGVPATAVGLDAMTLGLMRWVMARWHRVDFMNRFMAGTLTPRLQLDRLPGIKCAAHFMILGDPPADGRQYSAKELIGTGMSIQRFWLTATRLGLSLQPGMAPLCFATYVRDGRADALLEGQSKRARRIEAALSAIADNRPEAVLYAGRIGFAATRKNPSRSIRRPLADMTVPSG